MGNTALVNNNNKKKYFLRSFFQPRQSCRLCTLYFFYRQDNVIVWYSFCPALINVLSIFSCLCLEAISTLGVTFRFPSCDFLNPDVVDYDLRCVSDSCKLSLLVLHFSNFFVVSTSMSYC